jgi:arsenite-transporting ATPase
VLPGLDEIFALADLREKADSGQYDLIVVDCAPTAETIRLLSLPDVLAWYMDRAFPVTRRLNKVVAPVVSRLSSLPVASDSVFTAAERFYERIDGVRELLRDGEVTSARLVVNPERMVVAEARRTFTYLSMFGYEVDAVVSNRLLPEDITDPWFDRWRSIQAEQQEEIRDTFAPVPVLGAPLADDELLGPEALTAFGENLYGGTDPTTHRHRGRPLRVKDDGDTVRLILDLPFAEAGEVDVARRGDELQITVGPYRRPVALPDSLRRREVVAAGFDSGTLTVTFAEAAQDA